MSENCAITLQDRTVRFEAKNLGLAFDGTINEKGDEINGQMKIGNNSSPFVFKRIAELPKVAPTPVPKRPQTPSKPYPYIEEEVSYINKIDGNKLAGTLTLPSAKGKFPAVLLITGSGAQDRNETILGHQPFLVLADYLTRRGIAVLRVDDRGIGGSELGNRNVTSRNYAGDVLTGVEYLKTRQEINPKKIGLIGHSEGGMIAPMVAADSKDVAFIIMLAGLGQTGEEIIYKQDELSVKSNVSDPVVVAQIMPAIKNLLAILKSDADNQLAVKQINEAFTTQLNEIPENNKADFNSFTNSIKTGLPSLMSPWFRYFLAFNPRPILQKVKVPVLALNGENDTQVPAKENLEGINEALKSTGNKDFTVKSFPKLNHLFQTSQTGLVEEYGTIEETTAPIVLETISNWILKHTK